MSLIFQEHGEECDAASRCLAVSEEILMYHIGFRRHSCLLESDWVPGHLVRCLLG